MIPSKRRQKRKGKADLAFVVLEGKRHYLGPWDSPRSEREYRQIIARWLKGEAPGQTHCPEDIAVVQVANQWLEEQRPKFSSSHYCGLYAAAKVLIDLCGDMPADEFGPQELLTVRKAMIDGGEDRRPWSRSTVNRSVDVIKRIFRWAKTRKMISAATYEYLRDLEPLQRGESKAKEPRDVPPVPEKHLKKILPLVSAPVRALIELQLVTGARPGELVKLRAGDIDRSGDVWVASLTKHKTAHHGKDRIIYFGPRAQALLTPFLLRPDDQPLFSATEAERTRHANRPRKTPLNQGNRPKSDHGHLGASYSVASYRRAITRACEKAKVPVWSPGQLRHNFATKMRAEYGLDVAGTMMGHSRLETTQIYAEKNRKAMIQVAQQAG